MTVFLIHFSKKKRNFRKLLKSKCHIGCDKKKVYDQVALLCPEAAVVLPYKSMRSTLKRWTSPPVTYPAITKGIEELYSVMIKDEYQDLLEYSGGRLKVDLIKTTNSTSLLIWNPEYMIKFKNCEMLCGDGTFSQYPDIAPKKVTKYHQLYVIHAIWENTCFPVAWILLDRKTQNAYKSIFKVIFKKFKDYNP
ncbi:uncharacterized protein LOC123258919 [Cotesia glomerata]|uniref:uncharacterized protein LOC123258919 n=1 Tax=Cotesia glomerata TaxID=32391 RepID=UPI001D029DB2|nr:uncharacterized protein LOC123258919 [Cotesia glomerata]